MPRLFPSQLPCGQASTNQFREVLRLLGETNMKTLLRRMRIDDQGQDIAEYAVVLAVILVLVVGTVRLIGSNANNAFSTVASSLQ